MALVKLNAIVGAIFGIVAVYAVVATAQTSRATEHLERYPSLAICSTFGDRYCGQALRVAYCESRFDTTARNGQYRGLFQMGSWERSRFGHGSTALEQSRAAYRYFKATGRDWSPWECKP